MNKILAAVGVVLLLSGCVSSSPPKPQPQQNGQPLAIRAGLVGLPSEGEAFLQEVARRFSVGTGQEISAERFFAAAADLNDDGKAEILVRAPTANLCSDPLDCRVRIYTNRDQTWWLVGQVYALPLFAGEAGFPGYRVRLGPAKVAGWTVVTGASEALCWADRQTYPVAWLRPGIAGFPVDTAAGGYFRIAEPGGTCPEATAETGWQSGLLDRKDGRLPSEEVAAHVVLGTKDPLDADERNQLLAAVAAAGEEPKGAKARSGNLPKQVMWAKADLNDDGRPELIVLDTRRCGIEPACDAVVIARISGRWRKVGTFDVIGRTAPWLNVESRRHNGWFTLNNGRNRICRNGQSLNAISGTFNDNSAGVATGAFVAIATDQRCPSS